MTESESSRTARDPSMQNIKKSLEEHLTQHKAIYLVHQKDELIADVYRASGVTQILGRDGKVVDGKGEGMYMGTLFSSRQSNW